MTLRATFIFAAVLAAALFAQAQQPDEPNKGDAAAPSPVQRGAKIPETAVEIEPKRQPPSGVPAGPAQVVSAFFDLLQTGDVDKAYASLTKGSKIAEKPEELRTLKAKTKEALDAFGAIIGYDLVEAKAVGGRLVRCTYASHGKVFPLRWRFYFYKPEDAWRLIDLRVDDKLVGIFDEVEEKPAEPK